MTDKKNIKILYLITQSELGGAQKYVYDLAINLDPQRYRIEIATGGNTDSLWLNELKERGIKIYHLKHAVREINFWHDFLSVGEIYWLLNKAKPTIIHLNSSKVGVSGSLAAWLYKKITRQPLKIIYTAHGFVFNEPLTILRRAVYLHLERFAGLFKDKIICVSEKDKIVGLNNKVAYHKKFVTIHNGINPQRLNFLEQQTARQQINKLLPKLPLPATWVVTVANFYPTKGLIHLIRAAKILSEKYPDLYFVIIGEGGLRLDLEKEIRKLDLSNKVLLLGALDYASKYLKAFDIFCLPSIKEGFPYVILEAMAAEIPIVATSVGGVVEIIEQEKNGLIVLPERPKELAGAIEKIIKQSELKNIFAINNREQIKKFSLEKMIRETENVYQEQ